MGISKYQIQIGPVVSAKLAKPIQLGSMSGNRNEDGSGETHVEVFPNSFP
jgi:hypothetical protein